MTTLFIRTIIIYAAVFAVIRLMGKRQLADMQPFDFVVTLLIADVAAEPISDPGIPLLYGIVPVMALFMLHRSVSFLSLKSETIRNAVCGRPVLAVCKGVVLEDALRAADLTLDDLLELLREKDVFTISEIEYCLLETNGSISVLKKDNAPVPKSPLLVIAADGKLRRRSLPHAGISKKELERKLNDEAGLTVKDCFLICREGEYEVFAQEKMKKAGVLPKKHRLNM